MAIGRRIVDGFAQGVILVLLLVLLKASAATLHIKEYCETELLNATCPHPNDVILMRHARYGRMRLGRCVKLDYGHVGCSSDVLDLADSRCSGRRQCIIRIPDALFAKTKPCPDDLKPYMEATFECVRVVTPREKVCTKHSHLVTNVSTGYLSSMVSMETGCGSRDSPWRIQVKPGQTINISLFDFGSEGPSGENDVALVPRPLTQCHVYAMIRERTVHRMRNITVCGTKSRERNVYLSLTNSVEIGLVVTGGKDREKVKNPPFFLIKYEAVGCPDIEADEHAWVMRKQNDVIAGCNHTSHSWHLKCEGNEWVGKSGNCSMHSSAVPNRNHKDDKPLSYGSSILIIIAVALTIGVVVLAAGLLCLRKQRARFCGTSDVSSPDESDGEEEKTYVDRNYFHYGWTQKQEVPSPSKEPSVGVVRSGLVNEYGQLSGTQPCTPLLKKENRPTIYGPALPPCTCSHLTPSLYRLDGPQRNKRGSFEGQVDGEAFLGGSNPEQHQHYFVLDPDVLGGARTYGRLTPKSKSGSNRTAKQEEIYQLRTLKPVTQMTDLEKAAALCDCHKQFMQQQQNQAKKPSKQQIQNAPQSKTGSLQGGGGPSQSSSPSLPQVMGTRPPSSQQHVSQEVLLSNPGQSVGGRGEPQVVLPGSTKTNPPPPQPNSSSSYVGATSTEYLDNDVNERRAPDSRHTD